MNKATRAAFMVKARHDVDAALFRLDEVSKHLTSDEEIAALGAIAGLAAQILSIETLLTVMRDLQVHEEKQGKGG